MKNLFIKKWLWIAFIVIGAFSTVAQNVTSVNSNTANVQINLLLNNNELSITEGNMVTIPVAGDTLWAEAGADIASAAIGNVGIGTDTLPPDAKLTVKGKVHAEELIVKLNVPGPDYVFKEDYQLMNINTLEKFIHTNKHLPEIPSAIQMEKNGIRLSDMNMLILKKVEEMALYIIDHEERIVNLEQNSRLSTSCKSNTSKN